MQRIIVVLFAVLGLVATGCTSDDSTTETGAPDPSTETEAVSDGDAQSDAPSDDADGDADDDDPEEAGQAGRVDEDAQDGADGLSGAVQSLRSTPIGRALSQPDQTESARFDGVISVVGQPGSELPAELELIFSGSYDTATESSEMTMDFAGLFAAMAESDPEAAEGLALFGDLFSEPMQVITIGDQAWVKWGLLAMFGVEDKWLESDAESGASATDMGFGGAGAPTELLDQLADANADVEELGQETLRGTETTHYRAVVDVAALADDLSAAERAELEAELGASASASTTIEFWIDGDDLLHRMTLVMTDLPEAEAEGMERLEMTYDIYDHGLDPGIEAPPADQIVTEAELGLSLDDLGGLTG